MGVAWALWQLGYPDQALKRGNEGLALAQTLSHTFSLALAECFVGVLHQYRGQIHVAQKNAENAITLCTEYQLTNLFDCGTILRGWAMAHQERHQEGIVQIREGLVALRATGSDLRKPYFLCLLAEACIETKQIEDGFSALREALDAADKSEDRSYEVDIHRLKGELLLKQDERNPTEAMNCFRRAIEIARQQSARSLGLRATVSLARLLAKQGKRDEARTMLAEVYNWFTEGFDTADLKDAKALLDNLNE
jgi:predicted ATPase